MRNFKMIVTRLLIVASLLLPWTPAAALETFEAAGAITQRGYDQFTVNGEMYRISPSATLRSNASNRRSFADFEEGDHIWFRGKVLNGVNYVDIISYETPEPS